MLKGAAFPCLGLIAFSFAFLWLIAFDLVVGACHNPVKVRERASLPVWSGPALQVFLDLLVTVMMIPFTPNY